TWRKTTIAVTALAFVAALGGFALVQKQFFPTANRPELIVDLRLAQGASWAATDREVKKLEKWLGKSSHGAYYTTYLRARPPPIVRRRRQPALLPANGAGAAERQFRPGHRHDQRPGRARTGRCRPRSSLQQRFRGRARPRAAAAERPAGRLPRDVPRARRGSA